MRYWVARAKQTINGPFEEWVIRGDTGHWWTKKPPLTWEKGDRMFVWASSPQQEIVALGELTRPMAKKDKNGLHRYHLHYLTSVLKNPVSRPLLSANALLRKSILLKHGPSSSVVRLTDEEGEEIYRLVVQRNPETKTVWPELLTRTTTSASLPIDIDLEGKEGSKAFRTHIQIERDPKLVKAKKHAVLAEAGKLECEVCGFDFFEQYGEVGNGFCEVHHLQPLAQKGRRTTTLSDLAVVCSNCHRIIHRGRKLLSLQELHSRINLVSLAKKQE